MHMEGLPWVSCASTSCRHCQRRGLQLACNAPDRCSRCLLILVVVVWLLCLCFVIIVLHISFLYVYAMIMISAIVIFCFLHHVHHWLYCIAMSTSCHIAFGHSCCCHEHHVHCTQPYITCYFLLVCASALALSLSSHAHVSSPLPSSFLHVFASDIIPSSINVHLFPDDLTPCLIPLCQVSSILELFWLGSKMAQVWI